MIVTERIKTNSFLSSIAKTALSMLVVFVALEVGCRMYEVIKPLVSEPEPMLISPDPYLQMKLTPNFRSAPGKFPVVHINSLGFRGHEVTREKSPGTFRVVCLGDSFAYGHDNDDEMTYPALLEKELRQRLPGRQIEVINAGVPSYVSFQILANLAENILDLDPDLVILLPGFNDLADSSFPYWEPNFTFYLGWRGGPLPTFSSEKTENPFTFMMKHSALMRRMIKTVHKIRRKIMQVIEQEGRGFEQLREHERPLMAAQEKLLRNHPDSISTFNEEALRIYERNLRSIISLCRSAGVELWLLSRPHFLDSEIANEEKRLMIRMAQSFPQMGYVDWFNGLVRYDEALREIVSSTQTPLIDLYGFFGVRRDNLSLYTDLAHLSAEGNAEVAEILAARIMAEKFRAAFAA